MEKIIDGEVYKELKIKKLVVNGKEINGCIIPAEETSGVDELRVGIIIDNTDEKKENE